MNAELSGCAACGHRWTLHGGGPFRDRWCIGWDADLGVFCGCKIARPIPAATAPSVTVPVFGCAADTDRDRAESVDDEAHNS